mmetsp:Transcript_37754/g.74933  ORF Transcript_37754/g.74933 Transcript_37754/m.74933 type:complete len:206 (-) Transcript_37754:196-813(-)
MSKRTSIQRSSFQILRWRMASKHRGVLHMPRSICTLPTNTPQHKNKGKQTTAPREPLTKPTSPCFLAAAIGNNNSPTAHKEHNPINWMADTRPAMTSLGHVMFNAKFAACSALFSAFDFAPFFTSCLTSPVPTLSASTSITGVGSATAWWETQLQSSEARLRSIIPCALPRVQSCCCSCRCCFGRPTLASRWRAACFRRQPRCNS